MEKKKSKSGAASVRKKENDLSTLPPGVVRERFFFRAYCFVFYKNQSSENQCAETQAQSAFISC